MHSSYVDFLREELERQIAQCTTNAGQTIGVVFARDFGNDYLGALEKLHLKLSGKYFPPGYYIQRA